MGIFDWLRRQPKRDPQSIAGEIAALAFQLHPSAADRVEITLRAGRVVEMAVPGAGAPPLIASPEDRGRAIARLAELASELSRVVSTSGETLIAMRDRVIWMPAVVPARPPVTTR